MPDRPGMNPRCSAAVLNGAHALILVVVAAALRYPFPRSSGREMSFGNGWGERMPLRARSAEALPGRGGALRCV
jgi:hypothetical protein